MCALPVSMRPLPIVWDFQITEQGFVSRYGHLGGQYYRQYLPFGVLDDKAHPPKKIELVLYNLAMVKRNSKGFLDTGRY